MDEDARSRLEKMTDYERWSLEKLADLSGNQSIEVKTVEKLLKGESDNVIQPNGGINFNRTTTASIGAKQGKEAVKSVWPLIFASGYKGIDFIVEWLLEENGEKQKGDRFTFEEKMRKINGLYDEPQFELPAHLSEYPEVCERVFRLYSKLSSCRHNVVHGNEFQINDDVLLLSGDKNQYSFSETRLFSWAALPIVLVESVLTNTFDMITERQLKHYLDVLSDIHSLGEFDLTAHDGLVIDYPLEAINDPPLEWCPDQSRIDRAIRDVTGNDYYLHIIGEDDEETISRWLIPGDKWDAEKEYRLTEGWTEYGVRLNCES